MLCNFIKEAEKLLGGGGELEADMNRIEQHKLKRDQQKNEKNNKFKRQTIAYKTGSKNLRLSNSNKTKKIAKCFYFVCRASSTLLFRIFTFSIITPIIF